MPLSTSTTNGYQCHDDDSTAETLDDDNGECSQHPCAYLFHHNGGALGRANAIGSLALNSGNKPVRHRILPLDGNTENKHVRPVKMVAPVSSRSEFANMLATVAGNEGVFPTQKAALQNEEGRCVSCRRKFVNGGALAKHEANVGEFEQFRLEHNVAKGTFSFRSHNGLCLHCNKTLGTVAFKPKDMGWATWMAHPIGLTRHDPEAEHIVFVGVVEQGGTLTVQRTAEGAKPDWKTDFDLIIQTILEELHLGSCSLFQHPITHHQWCIVKYDAEMIGVVVSSEGFPPSLAAECHDDLTIWHKNSKDPRKLERIQQMGLDLERIVGKELAGLMEDHDEQCCASARNTKLSKSEQDLLDLQAKVTKNILELQNNMDSIEALNAKADDLLEMSKLFKKQTEKLPNSWKHATTSVGAGLGAGAGALAGWLIGGPGGALVLATEGMEIATGAAAAAVLGGSIGASTVISFWSRRFVKFVFQPKSHKATNATAPRPSGSLHGVVAWNCEVPLKTIFVACMPQVASDPSPSFPTATGVVLAARRCKQQTQTGRFCRRTPSMNFQGHCEPIHRAICAVLQNLMNLPAVILLRGLVVFAR